MPSADVFLMLRYFKERNKTGGNEIDLEEVDPENLANAIGATHG